MKAVVECMKVNRPGRQQSAAAKGKVGPAASEALVVGSGFPSEESSLWFKQSLFTFMQKWTKF